MKERIWTKDWFAALAYALVFSVLAYGVFSTGFQGLERAATTSACAATTARRPTA